MKRFFVLMLSLLCIGLTAGFAEPCSRKEGCMAYCTMTDLQSTYGAERIAAWSAVDAERAEKAIADASAEIDGYLLSGGYTVPLAGTPATIKKYCVDIACASLIISTGMLENDPGGKAVVEQADIARRYLDKVAQGKYKIPGYDENSSKPPSGNIQAVSMTRMDWKGY
ncbi:phage protein Gp36 family protein [Treponema sp. OMZ 805]|uniref:DUF1320 domain-containing protein n=1 Tax=Treponema sp. OMZ 805 TaxID=2726068 RepID=UPI00204B4187|nr:MAG TPA: head to tail adaptor [Caudoviricetes sp.]